MKIHLVSGLLAAALAAGCDSTIIGATGGAGGEGGSGGGTTTTVPDECSVPSDGLGPHAVTLRLTNPASSTGPVFLRQDCELDLEIRACSDGYQQPLSLSGACTVDCSQTNECIECGACLEEAIEIAPGASHDFVWSGLHYTFGENAVTCTCHEEHVAAAQKYRVYVPVFPSAEAALSNQPQFEATKDIDLPSAGAVDVELSAPAP